MANVLLVDDSLVARRLLRNVLERDPRILIVGEAGDPDEAVRLAQRLRPSLITMDLHLPRRDGIAVTGEIMRLAATPIVIVTGADARDPQLAYRALAAGALDLWPKPPPPMAPEYDAFAERFCAVVRALAGTPVVHRRPPTIQAEPSVASTERRLAARTPSAVERVPSSDQRLRAVLIGASTGGPPVIQRILARLPKPFALPIVVVQHIAAGFANGLAEWLEETTGVHTRVVNGPMVPEPGCLYLASDRSHLAVAPGGVLVPDDSPPRAFVKPAVDVTFESAAPHVDPRSIAILLTGMGGDGAAGLLALRRRGARTIVQQPETCAVPSMPRTAVALGAAAEVLAPDAIADLLARVGESPFGEITRS